MGNSLQRNLFDKCHKSRYLPELDQEGYDISKYEFIKLPPLKHQISLTRLHNNPKSQSLGNSYSIEKKSTRKGETVELKVFGNTIKFEEHSRSLLDGRTELERFLKALIKKDRLHRWQSLQQLNLWIFDIFDSSYLEPLADFIISRLRDIQGLKLVFNRDETFMWKSKVKGNELQAFIEKITKYMTHLTKFELTVRFLNGEDHHVKAIIRQILRNLPHLEVLTLCFKKCYSLTQKCIEAFKYQAQRHLPKLKTLNYLSETNRV